MMLKRTHHILQLIFALFVAYLLVSRLLITWVQHAPEQVVSVAEWLMNGEISIEKIEIQQSVLGFQLQVEGLNVNHADYELQLQRIELDANTFAPFFPSIHYGAYLKVYDGAFNLKSIPSDSPEKSLDISPLKIDQLRHFDVNVRGLWQRVKVENFTLKNVTRPGLSIHIHDFHSLKGSQLALSSVFSLGYRESLNFEKFSLTATLNPTVWGGLGHGQVSVTSFDALPTEPLVHLLPEAWHAILPKGELILDVEATISQSSLAKVAVNLNGQAFAWRQTNENLPSSMGLELLWSAQHKNIKSRASDWHFKLSKIQLDNKYIQTVSPIELHLEGTSLLHFSARYFDIEPFKVLVRSIVSNPHITTLFDKAVHLKISDVIGELNWRTLELPLLQVKLEQLSIPASQRPATQYPGLAIENLTIKKTANTFSLQTDKPIWVMQSEIHKKPMRLDFPAKVLIELEPDNYWRLPELAFQVNSLPVELSIRANNKGDVDGVLNLKVEQMSLLKEYLPYAYMPETLQKWLKKSLIAGESINLDVVLKGNLDAFPFNNGEGVFTANATIEKAKLKFDQQWPMLSDFTARLEFSPFQLKIAAQSVDIGANLIGKDVVVTIPDLDKKDIALNIEGKVAAKLDRAVDYLTISPLAKLLGLDDFFKHNAVLTGESFVSLDRIWVPLSGYPDRADEVSGSLEFKNATLILQEKLVFSKINGRLAFTEEGVESKKLTANFLEGTSTLNVTTDPKTNVVNITAEGIGFAESSDFFKKPLPWTADVKVPLKKSKVKGVAVDVALKVSEAQSLLPAPFTPEALTGKNLRVQVTSTLDSMQLSANLPGLVDIQGEWKVADNQYQIAQLSVALGEKNRTTASVKSSGMSISGRIEQLDLDGWRALYKGLPDKEWFKGSSLQGVWQLSHVNIQEMLLWGKAYPGIDLDWRSIDVETIQIGLKSPNIESEIRYNPAGVSQINLKHLEVFTKDTASLDEKKPAKTDSGVSVNNGKSCVKEAAIQKMLFSELNFQGKNITVDGKKIDSLEFTLKDTPDQLVLSKLKGYYGEQSGSIAGHYLFDKPTTTSQLTAKLNSTDVAAVGNFLQLKKGFSGSEASVDILLKWPGDLSCFSKMDVQGEIAFDLREGAIEDIEPGFARLIGLLSVESLARRLKLDLKDLTNKGMVYDRVHGKATVLNGQLVLESFELLAPSANAKISGQIDLIKETFNLKAAVTPAIGATIPTVVALVGGANPIAALAVYTLMKIIPGINENLITYHYQVTGPWSKPVIKRKN